MAFSSRLNALIIDPIAESRSTLKGLLQNEQTYHHLVYQGVTVANSIPDATELLRLGEPCDVIFVSLQFAIPVIHEFIKAVKAKDQYGGISFILICNTRAEQDRALVAQGIAVGADAFLIFPCSVDQLRTVSAVAQKIKIEAHERMVEAAMRILIESLVIEIEKKVEILYDDGDFTHFSKHLKSAVTNILEENLEMHNRYLEILGERLALAAPRIILPAERLPRSKRLQEKLKNRQSLSKK